MADPRFPVGPTSEGGGPLAPDAPMFRKIYVEMKELGPLWRGGGLRNKKSLIWSVVSGMA